MRYKIFLTISFFYLIFCVVPSQSRVYIDIGPPRIIPFPIAVSKFTIMENSHRALNTDNIRLALEAEKILLKDLKLAGFFDIFSLDDFPKKVREDFSIDKKQNVNFDHWNEYPAEALVLGSVIMREGKKENEANPSTMIDMSTVSDKRVSVKSKGLILRGACPVCGGMVTHEEGCVTCHSCGYSECS